jgi:hypothetical protein
MKKMPIHPIIIITKDSSLVGSFNGTWSCGGVKVELTV